MTYKEIKDRLSKCETTLEQLKNGKVTNLKPAELRKRTAQLEVLRESYIKQLKEAQEKTYLVTPKSGKTAALSLGDDEVDALKDADDIEKIKSSDGNEVKENEGIKFSIEETKSIAKSVGKAVAMSLKALGDSVSSMKAKNIEESSFEIYVQYKNGADDQFSFYITDDTLHLVDFSFDKELTDVGVKPSGEAIVNVDVLANELQKHFKSLNETEVSEAPEGMYYIKIPKDAASQNKAQVIFDDLYGIKYQINDDPKGIVMYFKKEDFDAGVIDDLEGDGVHILDTNVPIDEAQTTSVEDIIDPADYIEIAQNYLDGMDDTHTLSDDQLEDLGRRIVKQLYKGDFKAAMARHGGTNVNETEVDTAGGDLDVGHQDDEPNMLKKDLYDVITYASKLYKALDKYDQHDGEVDFPHWWQKKVTLAREYMSAAQHYLEGEEKQPAIDQLALEAQSHPVMVQQRIAHAKKAKEKQGASKEQETEFHKDLDTLVHKTFGKRKEELKEWGSSDQNIMNQSIHKELGEPKSMPSPFSNELESAAESAVDHYWDDWEEYDTDREGLIEHAKRAYLRAYFKETYNKLVQMFSESENGGINEDRFLAASLEDLVQVVSNIAHTAGMSEDEAIELAIRKLEAMLDGRDDLDEGRRDNDALYPDNPRLPEIKKLADKIVSMVKAEAAKGELGYIKTMEEIRYQQEDDFERTPEWNKAKGIRSDFDDYGSDTNEGIAKTQKAYGLVVAKMKELAKQYKAGDTSVITQLKDLTAKKKQLEKQLEKDVAGKNRGQQLDTSVEETIKEEKATYCGRCKTTHKKSSGCPK